MMTSAISRAGQADPRFASVPALFFGLGAQKCGTTWLHDYLAGHPEVRVPCVTKELHYWNGTRPPYTRPLGELPTGLAQLRRSVRRMGAQITAGPEDRALTAERAAWERALRGGDPGHHAYADVLFGGRVSQTAVGEITPYYALLDQATLAEMAALSPGSRFIFVMRDPVDRCLSGLRMMVARSNAGAVTPEALNAALAEALTEDSGRDLERSRYELTLQRLDAVVPAERIAVFFYETLFDQAELDRLTAFLGVSPHPGDVSRRVFAGTHGEVSVDPTLLGALGAALGETYDFVADRFGTLVPKAWQRCEPPEPAIVRTT